jgi:hypothetical protein
MIRDEEMWETIRILNAARPARPSRSYTERYRGVARYAFAVPATRASRPVGRLLPLLALTMAVALSGVVSGLLAL